MLTRREFLEVAGVGAAGLLVPWNRARATPPTPIDPSTLTKYVDPLPIPSVLSPTSPGGSHFRVERSEFAQQLHQKLPNPTTVWGYTARTQARRSRLGRTSRSPSSGSTT